MLFLTLSVQWSNLADDKLMLLSYLSQKIRFFNSCKLSPQVLFSRKQFSGKSKKNISKCRLLKYLPSMLRFPTVSLGLTTLIIRVCQVKKGL